MEKEKLIIKNFGPIKSISLDLGKFNVLIGEQATGKSTVAKVLAVCRYFSYIALDSTEDYGESRFSEGLTAWGLNEALKEDSLIIYECRHYSLTVNQIPNIIKGNVIQSFNNLKLRERFNFRPSLKAVSPEFKALLVELKKIWRPTLRVAGVLENRLPTSFFQNDVAAVMDNPFYLPAERGLQSIFSLGRSSIENISDSLFNQFARLDQITRLFKNDTIIEPLQIVYKNVEGRGYIRKNNEEEFYSLYNAASGYQSTIPVVLLSKYYSEIRQKSKTFFIEEPELNLFPNAQQKLMQYLVDSVINYKNSILLTTHSPYILSSLNNLMYSYQIGQLHKEKVNEVIEEKYWINPKDVSAYLLKYDGTQKGVVHEDILDKDGMIKADKIDGVSAILNSDFNAIMDIELNIKK